MVNKWGAVILYQVLSKPQEELFYIGTQKARKLIPEHLLPLSPPSAGQPLAFNGFSKLIFPERGRSHELILSRPTSTSWCELSECRTSPRNFSDIVTDADTQTHTHAHTPQQLGYHRDSGEALELDNVSPLTKLKSCWPHCRGVLLSEWSVYYVKIPS